MSSNPGNTQAGGEPLDEDPTGQDPTAVDPGEDWKVQLQLAIFDVTRNAKGRNQDEIRDLLLAEFSRRGIESPPGTWLDSVASSAHYGEPYIVDLPAAVAADALEPAPTEDVREGLAARRELRHEKLPDGILPAPSEWNIPANEVTAGSTPKASLTGRNGAAVLAAAAAAVAAAALVAVAVRKRTGRRRVDA
ncbi:hypothetical protein ACFVVC_17890 [Pseudarthrobacter sp. NPDC058196]|uniref:hypothetical protein n=1 Tax=Pseudarthrobacter sp. NPDC058196 TaxID=3346376 RepID=UPI0036D83C54